MQEVTGSSPVPSTKTRASDFGQGLFCCVTHQPTSEQDGTGLEQHGHAAGVANNSPVGCCLVRGFQRLGMSTKKAPPAGAPFAEPRFMQYRTGTMYVRAIRKKQRQGITMTVVSCLLFCGIKFALCELGRPPIWQHWGQSLRRCVPGDCVRTYAAQRLSSRIWYCSFFWEYGILSSINRIYKGESR